MTYVKKVDCALLPHCAKTVHNKMQRAHFISIRWGNADSAHPGHCLDPLNYGWKEKTGYYKGNEKRIVKRITRCCYCF